MKKSNPPKLSPSTALRLGSDGRVFAVVWLRRRGPGLHHCDLNWKDRNVTFWQQTLLPIFSSILTFLSGISYMYHYHFWFHLHRISRREVPGHRCNNRFQGYDLFQYLMKKFNKGSEKKYAHILQLVVGSISGTSPINQAIKQAIPIEFYADHCYVDVCKNCPFLTVYWF